MPECGAANHVRGSRTRPSNGRLAGALPAQETSQRQLWVCSLTDARVATFPAFFREPGCLENRLSMGPGRSRVDFHRRWLGGGMTRIAARCEAKREAIRSGLPLKTWSAYAVRDAKTR